MIGPARQTRGPGDRLHQTLAERLRAAINHILEHKKAFHRILVAHESAP